jgi:hypothetical protein
VALKQQGWSLFFKLTQYRLSARKMGELRSAWIALVLQPSVRE